METLMTIEDFRQLVLFQLIDDIIPDIYEWIAVDSDGFIYAYVDIPNSGSAVWGAGTGNGRHISYNTILIPKHLSWRDCLWKL